GPAVSPTPAPLPPVASTSPPSPPPPRPSPPRPSATAEGPSTSSDPASQVPATPPAAVPKSSYAQAPAPPAPAPTPVRPPISPGVQLADARPAPVISGTLVRHPAAERNVPQPVTLEFVGTSGGLDLDIDLVGPGASSDIAKGVSSKNGRVIGSPLQPGRYRVV